MDVLRYRLVLFLINLFVYLGYNGSFFLDNMLALPAVSPLISWGLYGVFIGACIGVGMAVKKYKLAKKLLLAPLGVVIAFTAVMWLANKPTAYASSFNLYNPPTYTTPASDPSVAYPIYTINTNVNVRTDYSNRSRIAFVISRGAEIQLMARGFYDSRRVEWAKIRYQGNEGYVNYKLIRQRY